MNKTPKRIAAAIVSLALGLSAGSYAMPMATAETASALINLDAPISLTINKYFGENEDDAVPGNALSGIQFRIERVDLGADADLGTVAGWTKVQDILDSDNATELEIDTSFTAVTIPTNSAGQAVLSTAINDSFTAGVYRITELYDSEYRVAAPFLVALPYTGSNGAWSYELTVDPKSQQRVNVQKGVEDTGATLGETINYTIDAFVPPSDLDRFAIVDNYPIELSAPSGLSVRAEGASGNAPVVIDLDDYKEVFLAGAEPTYTITFNETGLAKLQAARVNEPALKVVIEFDAVIDTYPENGIIENHVNVQLPNGGEISTDPEDDNGPDPKPLDPENPGGPIDPNDPGEGAQTRFGDLTITKTRENEDNELPLVGAEFQLWRCVEAEGATGTYETTGDDPVGVAVGTSAADPDLRNQFRLDAGEAVTIENVQAHNWVNGGPAEDDLCVVEVVAPEGYSLNPEPQLVTLNTADNAGDFDMAATVVNLDDTLAGNLPATGGNGALMIIAAGLVVAAAGGTVAVRGNRARKNA